MRLFGKVDGQINRFDRAQYLTGPFDLAFAAPSNPIYGPIGMEAAQAYVHGMRSAKSRIDGAQACQAVVSGMHSTEVL